MLERRPVSIEYAHTILDPQNRSAETLSDIQLSAEIAAAIACKLNDEDIATQKVVMFDDKLLSPVLDRESEAADLLGSLPLRPDVAIFESDLRQLASSFLAAIPEPRQSQLHRAIEKRAHKGLPLLCSIDISIWHLLRLGLLELSSLPSAARRSFVGLSESSICVSVLTNREMPYEDRALRENLTLIPSLDESRIRNFYFPPGAGIEDVRAELDMFITNLAKGYRNA